MKPDWVSDQKEIFKNHFLRLYSVQARFGGRSKEYFVTEKGSRVGVILEQKDKVLLVRQYRFLIDGDSWELPGGGVGAKESLEAAATRECREEAGVRCRSLTPLFSYLLGLDVTDCRVHIFRTDDFEDVGLKANDETDSRRWVTLDDCLGMVQRREIRDSMTVVSLLYRYWQHASSTAKPGSGRP
jgi:ADP-ribose pyrophosphatase